MREREQQVMAACRAAFVRGPLSAKEAATEAVPVDRVRHWYDGTKSPRAWEVAELLPGLLAQDHAAAMEWASACLGLRALGLELVQVPGALPIDALVLDGLQLAAACGVLAGEIAHAALDGTVTREERIRIAAAARPVVREALEIGAQVAL
jgi:hypothetical protein